MELIWKMGMVSQNSPQLNVLMVADRLSRFHYYVTTNPLSTTKTGAKDTMSIQDSERSLLGRTVEVRLEARVLPRTLERR